MNSQPGRLRLRLTCDTVASQIRHTPAALREQSKSLVLAVVHPPGHGQVSASRRGGELLTRTGLIQSVRRRDP